ncbi:MAG TPA: tetratricopeptide repeat protein [Pyrinomonadaceae bacterium]|nr:tetratricopeptide repeat protein [Pyrinomonadaceae bacterium]
MKRKEFAHAPQHDAAQSAAAHGGSLTEGRILFLLVAVTVLVYANSLGGQFLFDDTKQIVGNPQLHSWSNVFSAFTSDVWSFQRGTVTNDIPLPYYRPLFTIYLTVGYQLFGLWEPGWHLLNLLVHVLATVAVYYLVRRLSGNVTVAAVAALLFGVHPAHVESVSWISGIPDPLAALFYAPALTAYVRYRQEGGRRWLACSVAAFALAILCKETAFALPLVVFVWELARAGAASKFVSRVKNAVLFLIPYAAIAGVYLALRFSVLGKLSWKHPMMAQVPDSSIWMTVPYVLIKYLQHLVAPFYLSLIYGTTYVRSAASAQFVAPVMLLTAIAAVIWLYRRRITSDYLTATALILAPLLPVLNLKVFHQEYLIQDRYLYLPSIGFCYLVALLLVRLARSRRSLAFAVGALVLLSFGTSTLLQNRVWNNGVALWGRAVAYAPQAWSSHYNLGLAYLNRRNYEAARAEFLTAIRLNANVAGFHNNLALAEDALGDEAAAIGSLQRALALDPGLLEARNNLGAILFRRGQYAAAREQFMLAYERDPGSLSVRFNLARLLAATGEHARAIPLYEAVVSEAPDDAQGRYHLGLSYAATGRKSNAIAQIERALSGERDTGHAAEMHAALDRLRQP